MKDKRSYASGLKRVLATVCVISLLIGVGMLVTPSASAADIDSVANRFNVMVVLDASASMNNTDPYKLRYEAINQFTNLLAEHGNYLGGIVFSTRISLTKTPVIVNSQLDKDQITQAFEAVPASGSTNIGTALLEAVNALNKYGNPDLPSVILFLSDGNTDMDVPRELTESLNNKAEAIQLARESGIKIYSVCLNARKTADTSEMEQISRSTGGVFQEVESAEDLGVVFNTFYNLIYGTSTIMLVDDAFSGEGTVEKTFVVPGIGVEEINIIIYGNASALALYKPNGEESKVAVATMNSLTMVKITDVESGSWRLTAAGVPGDKIKINMVYNTDLAVKVALLTDAAVIDTATSAVISATLMSGVQPATKAEQYVGYSAELCILDTYENEIKRIPMEVVGNHFEVSRPLDEGTYKFKVIVSGDHLTKETEVVGPLKVVKADVIEDVIENFVANTPPEAVEDPVQRTVYIWPFVGGSFTMDLNSLAEDPQGDEIRYKIISSSFIEGTDYSLSSDGILTIDHFSLSKGAFTVRATDSEGLYCDIEVVITSRNIGLMALIGIGAAGLVFLSVSAILLYIALNKRFMGVC